MTNTTSMMRFQRTFDRQIEKKQIRIRQMLLNWVRRVVRMNILEIFMNMKLVVDLYCDEIEDLSVENDEDNFSIDSTIIIIRWWHEYTDLNQARCRTCDINESREHCMI
jgi:hypothetical protein